MNRYDPEQITFFAKTDARGQEVPFGIKAKDRTRHVYVIGKTGMGKSTLLENMAVQDIKNGNGLAFIDPHGQTAETLLSYIPEERLDDVLYFAPFDTDYPVSFNVMEDVGPDRRHLVVSGLMSVFKKIWVDAWSARMEYILSNTLLALLEYPDSTLLGVNRMLSDAGYRMKVINNITDPAVKSFWVDEFLNYNERYMQEAGDAIKNKIGQFTSNPLIRNIIGQPKSSFDLRKMMDEQKIVIMNLSKGLVGESNANLLGSMLTTRLYLAAMSRANLTPEELKQAPNFYFFVDEFQSFANATFADILSEARKYKLNLTIAHQYIEQMEEEVRNAVFGNVGTTITFRVGPFDAEVLESVFTPKFLAPDIVNLGFAQIYLTLMIDGIGSHPFSATTLPPIEPPQVSLRDEVCKRSRKNYAHPRSSVEAMINAWHAEEHPAPNKKGNDKGKKPFSAQGNGNNKPRSNHNNSGAANHQDRKPAPDRPREPSEQRDPKPSNTEKSAEELRAILRSIAGASKPRDESRDAPTSADKDSRPQVEQKVVRSEEHVEKKERREHDHPSERRGHEQSRDRREQSTVAEQKQSAAREPREHNARPERHERHDDRPKSDKQKRHQKNNAPRQQRQEQRPHEEKQNPPAPDLKAALAQALAGVAHSSVATPVADATKTETDQAKKIPAQEVTAQIDDTQSSQATPAARKEDDPLSPKKLERMMRVTGSDRTPLA